MTACEGEFWRVEAYSGVASVDKCLCGPFPVPGWSLEAFFRKLGFPLSSPGPFDKAHGMAATTPTYGRP